MTTLHEISAAELAGQAKALKHMLKCQVGDTLLVPRKWAEKLVEQADIVQPEKVRGR